MSPRDRRPFGVVPEQDDEPGLRHARRQLPMWVRIAAVLIGAAVGPAGVLTGLASWTIKVSGVAMQSDVGPQLSAIVQRQQTADAIAAAGNTQIAARLKTIDTSLASQLSAIEGLKRRVSKRSAVAMGAVTP